MVGNLRAENAFAEETHRGLLNHDTIYLDDLVPLLDPPRFLRREPWLQARNDQRDLIRRKLEREPHAKTPLLRSAISSGGRSTAFARI